MVGENNKENSDLFNLELPKFVQLQSTLLFAFVYLSFPLRWQIEHYIRAFLAAQFGNYLSRGYSTYFPVRGLSQSAVFLLEELDHPQALRKSWEQRSLFLRAVSWFFLGPLRSRSLRKNIFMPSKTSLSCCLPLTIFRISPVVAGARELGMFWAFFIDKTECAIKNILHMEKQRSSLLGMSQQEWVHISGKNGQKNGVWPWENVTNIS